MALAWVNRQPFVTANIIGATTLEELLTNLASIALDLPENVVEAIESIHRRQPNRCP